jgi:hypothetical protein
LQKEPKTEKGERRKKQLRNKIKKRHRKKNRMDGGLKRQRWRIIEQG